MHEGSAKAWLPSKGVAPLFKGDSPHLRPQPSWTESSPARSKVLPLRHGGWVPRIVLAGPGQKEPKPSRAMRATAQRLRAFLHFRPDQRVKGRTAMQAACNRTKGAHPFDFNASSMEAQAHTSCNQRRLLRARNCTATCASTAPSRLRNWSHDSRRPCAWPNNANRAHRSWVSQPREKARRSIWPEVGRQ
jgi:hypothetical protein